MVELWPIEANRKEPANSLRALWKRSRDEVKADGSCLIVQYEGVAGDCGRRKRDCRHLAGADSRMLSPSLALGLVAGGCARGALLFDGGNH